MKKVLYILPMFVLLASMLLISFQPIFAGTALQQEIQTATDVVGKEGFDQDAASAVDLPSTVGRVIRIIIGFLGVVMVVIIVYAGFLWMTGGGDPDKIKDAKSWMLNAVIGLIILLAAYTISNFVIEKVFEALE